MVPKQPPPSFKAPYPDISPLNKLFILVIVCVWIKKDETALGLIIPKKH